jgi:hypothetical protein
MDPSKRFLTLVLVVGVAVLVAAIVIGEHMGNRVLSEAGSGPEAMPIVTPVPTETVAPYGPDWKRVTTLAVAPDPDFPDPRVPPKPLPTLSPTPKPNTPKPSPSPTYNPNLPIWDQRPFRSLNPSSTPSIEPSASLSPSPGTKILEATPQPK